MNGRALGILCLAGCLLAGARAGAQTATQPAVGVRFALAEPSFANRYDAATRKAIADSCARRFATALDRALGFADFTSGDAANLLTVTLGLTADTRGVAAGLWPVDLTLDLAGPAVVEKTTPVRWEYRAESRFFDLIPPADELVDDLDRLVAGQLDRDGGRAELVENLFSKMVLAQQAFPLRDEASFLLPFSRGQWRIGAESEFCVVADVTTSTHTQSNRTHRVVDVGDCTQLTAGAPSFYLRKIQVRLVDDALKADELRRASRVVPREIFLTVYRAPRDTVAVATPTALDLGGEQP